MRRANRLFAVQTLLLVNICFLGLGFAQRDKFLGGLIDYLNNLPNQPYVYEDGLLLTSHNAGDNVYNLEVSLKARDVQDPKSFKLLKCTATVQDNGDSGVTVLENEHHCHEDITQPPGPQSGAGGEDGGEEAGVTDAPIQEVPVKLDNEVQSDTAVTSGEQFVAIPRVVHNPPCIGCSSPVDPAAPGVRELALLGVRHLDRHDPNFRHNLKGVFEVERQVQVVNGVRYILTLNVDYNNCTTSETDVCSSNKTCKISILEKPWVKLPDGSKFRAILANNCTENWLFGDDGEVLPPEDRNNEKNQINSINVHDDKDIQGTDEDFLKVVYQTNTQAKPATERTLSEHDIKLLEEQIIPNNEENTAEVPNIKVTKEPINVIQKKENTVQKEVFLVQTEENVANNIHIDNNNHNEKVKENQIKKTANAKTSTLSDQKKKDIDDLLSFLNYADFAPKQLEKEQSPRMRRSFDFDLKVLGLTEKFKNIKKQVADARTVTELAKFLVNYMNEMDIQMKTRELKDVLKAEEEFDNDQQFVYIQVRVYTPCGEMGCDINDDVTNICNAIIDNSVSKSPKILNHFCYEEKLTDPFHGKVTEIPLDDPVLQYLVEDVLKKIEAESDIPNAINLRVLQANTRQTVGIVTEMITENVYTNCNKTVPHSLRDNCTALKNVGSKVCEVVIMDRSWLNEKQISYTCTKRGVDEQVTTESSKKLRGNIKDPEILAMAHLALRQLEELSNIDYRQKVVDVTKVSTQLVAGLLTNLEFDVGYTTCSHTDTEIRLEDCKLVKGMPLRKCEAQIWDRSWLIDGKQVKVSCDDTSTVSSDLSNNEIFRKKRDVGEETEQDSDKEEYQRLAIDAMNTYVQQSGNWTSSVTKNRRYGETDPKDPRYQVLAEDALQVFVTREKLSGVWKVAKVNQVNLSSMHAHNPYNNTHIFFTISNNEGVSRSCRALIFYMNNKKRIRIRCSPTQIRHLVGAVQLMDPGAQKYQILAKESLEKYATETKLSGVWRVDEVTKVTYQIISGSLTQIDFTISNMGASIPCHSQIWEQPWLNKKDITVNCQLVEETDKTIMVRGKGNQDSSDPKYKVPVIGGEKEKTTNKKKYKRLAKEAMEKYLKQTCCSNAQVIQVLGVTTQLVEGLKTKIDFEILQDDSLILICHASILEQSWLNKKDITVTCSKSRKSAGTFVKDPSKPKYMELAKKSMNLYFNLIPKMKGGGAQWTSFNVTNVSNTVNPVNWLSGSLIDLYFKVNNTGSTTVGKVLSCHTKIWAKPWLKREDIFDVECGLDSRRKREIVGGLGDLIQLVGGQTQQDPTNSKYLILAKRGLDKYAQQSGTTAEVTKVLHVTTQVVAGVKTVIDFEILQNGTVNLICKTIVLEQSWLNNTDIATECQEIKREKRQLSGGKTKLDPKDPKYQILAEKSLQKHVSQKGLSGVWKVAEVTEVTTQVVSGILTEIAFNSVENGGQLLSCKSTIWERLWLNEEKITVDCTEAARKKRQVVGGSTEKDPNDPIYQVLAEESLQKHVSQNGLAGVWKVAEVTKVTYQVVAGSITKIDFNTAENGGQVLFCHSNVFEQRWLNKKEITVNCQEIEREKRQLPGGKMKLDPKDPKYQILAEKSLQKHVSQKGLSGVWKVAEVTEVTTQVVSGILTEIAFNSVENGGQLLSCKSTIWERLWLNEEKITVDCTEAARKKRRVVGGSTEKDPNDPIYQVLAEESLQKHVSQNGLAGVWKVAEVTKVTYQVVAGSITKIDFNTAENGGQVLFCHSNVFEQPWLNKKEITVNCQEIEREKRQLSGGKTKLDPKDPKYQILAEKSLQKHVSQKGLSGVWKVAEVTEVTTQVVSGILTEIAFNSVENGGQLLSCKSTIWERLWLNEEKITVDCTEAARKKRQVVGGSTEKDPNDPIYQVLAEESLQKHVSQNGLAGVWKVAEVTKVTYQVVAGSITKIDFNTAENGGQVLFCHSNVFEQPWLNKKEITVNCQEIEREKRQLSGGKTKLDPKDPKYQILAEKSLQKHVSQKGLSGVWKVAEVTEVTTQVVSGILTEIAFNSVENGGQLLSCKSTIWERLWLNEEKITVDCTEAARKKRQVVGGSTEKDPNDPIYQVLAEESLQKHVSQNGLAGVWKVAEVTKVTYQVVAGSITKIDFNTAENGGQVLFCHSNVFEQRWLNKKEITVNCQEIEREKRQLPGGETKLDPNNPKYQILAEKSLQKHVSQKGLSGVWKVAEVTEVTTQVVSGISTEIAFNSVENGGQLLSCKSTIRERPWLNEEEITVDCTETGRQKREVSGGSVEKEKEKEHKQLAEEALKKYDKDSNSKYSHRVLKLRHVYQYNVSEHVTAIEFTMATTKCVRADEQKKVNCDVDASTIPFICQAVIEKKDNDSRMFTQCTEKKALQKKNIFSANEHVEKSTDKSRVVTPPITSDARFKRQIRPDDFEIDDDVKFIYAEKALEQLNLRSDTQNMQKLVAIHSVATSMQMGTLLVRMYIEVGYTFCLKQNKPSDMAYCDEMDGLNHRLCLVKIYPTPEDDTIVKHVATVCDDEADFEQSSGLNVLELIKISLNHIEEKDNLHYKLVHQGEANLVPSLDTSEPIKLSFIVATTNCSKNDVDDIYDYRSWQENLQRKDCVVLESIHPQGCSSFIWMSEKTVKHVKAICRSIEAATRLKRSTNSIDAKNSTSATVEEMVNESIHKLEMTNIYKFKQRVLQINSFNTKITTGQLTTIDFDVGYTSCLKYEWVDDISKCEFLEHLPRRHCVSMIYERLWISNGRRIHVNCEDDETPLEVHTEFENAQLATNLAEEALKHIEFKYPHPQRQKVVRIFSVDKQTIAGLHYRIKLEVGFTDCLALSVSTDCNFVKEKGENKFCRANIWVRPWTEHPPIVRVTCDYQEAATTEIYHQVQAEHLFYDFIITHKPSYSSDPIEMRERFQIFKANLRRIQELNTRERGTARYAVTQFADLSYEEFSSKYLGLKPGLRDENQVSRAPAHIPDHEIPDSFDWRDHGAVTPVKNQGSCGSCWAFSVIGNIEGQYKLRAGKLLSLSEQELVDCDTLDEGCNGGMPDNAYRAIETLGGLETEDDYPYEGENDKCTFNKTLTRVQLSGAVNISSNETDMAKWLVQNGPISIAINANAMQFYVGGISHPWRMLCNPNNLDHGVLIVGYGVKTYPLFHKTLPYWIVKNSWGASWGEQGYYRVFRGDGTCGLNTLASSAIVATPNDE